MIEITRFDPETAPGGHNDTILAGGIVPPSLHAPIGHAYGYLTSGNSMEGHDHPTEEFYMVMSGEGIVTVGEETAQVGPGDVIAIPPGAWHTMTCKEGGQPFLWAAFWWNAPEA